MPSIPVAGITASGVVALPARRQVAVLAASSDAASSRASD